MNLKKEKKYIYRITFFIIKKYNLKYLTDFRDQGATRSAHSSAFVVKYE